jgi:hypothetical protein
VTPQVAIVAISWLQKLYTCIYKTEKFLNSFRKENKKMATVENCSLADRMDRVYEKD